MEIVVDLEMVDLETVDLEIVVLCYRYSDRMGTLLRHTPSALGSHGTK